MSNMIIPFSIGLYKRAFVLNQFRSFIDTTNIAYITPNDILHNIFVPFISECELIYSSSHNIFLRIKRK